MKGALLVLALAACRAGAPMAQPPSQAPTVGRAATGHGVHGMVLFGRTRLYGSHLPLYRGPHAAQVVIELELDDATAAAYHRDLGAAPLVTFAPEPFDLGRLAPDAATPIETVTGTIYRGHFERGGVPWRARVALGVRRVLVFRTLAPTDAHPPAPSYLAFGAGDETFLLHRIDGRPGCDQLAAVTGPAPVAGAIDVIDEVASGERADPCPAPPIATAARHGWRWQRVIYEERADLR